MPHDDLYPISTDVPANMPDSLQILQGGDIASDAKRLVDHIVPVDERLITIHRTAYQMQFVSVLAQETELPVKETLCSREQREDMEDFH